jgi:hypothetical protein
LFGRAFADLFNCGEEFLSTNRFRHVPVHTRCQTPFLITLHRVGGHRNDGKMFPSSPFFFSNGAGCLQTSHARHLQIHEHHVKRLLFNLRESYFASCGDVDCMAPLLKQSKRELLVYGIVLGNEDPQPLPAVAQ